MVEDLFIFKYHPRMLELRLTMVKQQIERQYGAESCDTYLKNLCDMFQCNWVIIQGVLGKEHKIMANATANAVRKRQELILMGYLYDESRLYVSKHYLNMSSSYLYQSKKTGNPQFYATEEWLKVLDSEIVACGVRAYAIEVKRFLMSFDTFLQAFK